MSDTPIIKSTGWATAQEYTLAPYDGLPTKQTPSLAVQQNGIVPNVAPGAAEINYQLANFDHMVGAIERFEVMNFRPPQDTGWSANEVGPFAVRTPTGGVMLFRSSTLYIFDQTVNLASSFTYDPTQAQGTGVLVPPNNGFLCTDIATGPSRDVVALSYDTFVELLGTKTDVWPVNSAQWAGGRTTLTLSESVTSLTSAWDDTNQILHMVTPDGYGNWSLATDEDVNGNNVFLDQDITVPFNTFPMPFASLPVLETGNGVTMACDDVSCYVSLDGRNWTVQPSLPVFNARPQIRSRHWWSEFQQRWYLIIRSFNPTTADLILYESLDNGASWSQVSNLTALTGSVITELVPTANPTVRLRHMALLPFDVGPGAFVSDNLITSPGIVVFDEVDGTISLQHMAGNGVNWLANDGNRLLWCTGDAGALEISSSLGLTSGGTPRV